MNAQEQDRLLLKIYLPFARKIKSEINRYIKTISDNFFSEPAAVESDRYFSEHLNNINKIWQYYSLEAIKQFGSNTSVKTSERSEGLKLDYRIKAPKEYNLYFDFLFSQWVQKQGASKITNIAKTTQNNIRALIQRETTDEFSTQQIAKKILELKSYTTYRARTIALTETHAAAMYSSEETAKKIGQDNDLTISKTWVAVEDERTRTSHKQIDGTTIGQNEDFDVPTSNGLTEKMSRPSDPRGSAENVINCRCALTYEGE